MNTNLVNQYQTLLQRIETAKQEAHRAEGVMEQLKQELLEDYGCKTYREATAKLEELETKALEYEAKFETALSDFEEKWDEKLS